jgi:hypothetical protein
MQMEIRSLTVAETELLKMALAAAAKNTAFHPSIRTGAQKMLDQQMPDNFLWISHK